MRLRSLLRDARGQTVGMAVLWMTVLLGMAAAVLDIGSWYRADRAAQATVDAAALAGAQALPFSTPEATALALDYAEKNDGGLEPTGITFSDGLVLSDTINVELKRAAPGFFAKLFGIDSVTVAAKASARASEIASAKYVAPFAVDKRHPLLTGSFGGKQCPCFEVPTELELDKVAPGAFRIMNIDGSRGGTGQQILASWILTGYDEFMPLGWYFSDSGAKFNASEVKAAMTDRLEDELLFPVYDVVRGGGSNAEYRVVGWVGFHVTDFKGSGNNGKIYGWFTQYIAQGLAATNNSGQPTFGTRTIALVD